MTRQGRHCSADQGGPDCTIEACYDRSGRVVELGETFYRDDRYRFHATLVRERRHGGGKTG